jgi:hypothetical protein
MISETIEFLELFFLQNARDGTHVVAPCVDVSAEVAVHAGGIRGIDVAWVSVRFLTGRDGEPARGKEE